MLGKQAAQSYPIQPGSTLRLWDDTADIFYMKTADQAGNVTIRTFDYTERGTTQPAQTQPDFQEAIDKLDDKFQRQINRLNSIIGNLRKSGEISSNSSATVQLLSSHLYLVALGHPYSEAGMAIVASYTSGSNKVTWIKTKTGVTISEDSSLVLTIAADATVWYTVVDMGAI